MRNRLPRAIGTSLTIVTCWGCSGTTNEGSPNAGGDTSVGGAATGGVSNVNNPGTGAWRPPVVHPRRAG